MEEVDFGIAGQVALVTGASRGIGRDLVLALAAAGAVVGAAARTTSDLDHLVAEVAAGGGTAFTVAMDVADVASVRRAVAEVEAVHGRIDILVNDAGLGFNHDALDVTEDDWDQMMAVNARGLFFVTQAVAAGMVARRYGRVVHISSQAGLVGIPRHAVYAASKGAVTMLTKVLALEWAPFGVTVNAVAPTFVRTPGTAARLDDPAFAADVVSRIPVGHVGTTTDVAAAVRYLASPAAGLVTGTVLVVDGGWTAQ
ncbi:MAG: 3-oxoacyl-ACP reductase [Cellulomonas sp. 73-92]|uniref:SDR family NAD(P)-dependent oxidoreductase n=1 Tax=Cellulomonas sp. 73-92 TaxID=1895740 RepID=UPI0009291829|nr:SDR family oxidoreductase [Cellulomonas sp. 73-92]OJV80248.1 MAG: 3-oxoacyl-ACP reductase [Cellulomonas sp. 73-92]